MESKVIDRSPGRQGAGYRGPQDDNVHSDRVSGLLGPIPRSLMVWSIIVILTVSVMLVIFFILFRYKGFN